MMLKLLQLFYIFFKIGIFSFGGGYTMLAMIQKDIETFGLMPSKEFQNLVALSNMTPGPIAVNAATYVGYKYAGFWGAVSATVGVSLPSFIIILMIIAFMARFKSSTVVQAVLSGIRPATVGMIASAVILFSKGTIFNENFLGRELLTNPIKFISLPALIIFIITLLGSRKYKVGKFTLGLGPITLTVLAGVIGAFIM